LTDEFRQPEQAAIHWEGDSLNVISGFPDGAKQNLGHQLRLLQQGERPTNYRPVTSIGSGVFELRDEDERAWYRVIYLSRIAGVIHVLHCLEKKSREIPKNDMQLAQRRFQAVRARIAEERKREKRS
jgi:phage-related protein